MERKELYAKIQQLGLQEEVKNTYGKNYTMVSNDNLERIIWKYDATLASKDPDAPATEETTKPQTETTQTEDAYEAACLVFLGILKDSGKLDDLLAKL
jgi:endo-1,4-beta-D-glucanase Y